MLASPGGRVPERARQTSIKSGRYIIVNVQHQNSAFLSDPNDGTFIVGSHEHGIVGDEWNVKRFPNGGYSITNFVHKMSASAEYRPQKGASIVGRGRDRIWQIKSRGSGGKYTIATANDELRWCLEEGWPETPITLHNAPPSDSRCQWIFQEIGRVGRASYEAANEEMAAAKEELDRMAGEVEEAKREVAQAKALAAENAVKREKAELEASNKAAELEQVKREAARISKELQKAKQESAQAKAEVLRILAELETARKEAAEAEIFKQQHLAEYNEKKSKKAKTIVKSLVTMDVKPWDDETDMVELEKAVRGIEQKGLVWTSSKLVPVGYGVKKLQIDLVIEDEFVSLDQLQNKITEFEDYVQGTDIAAMKKLKA